MRWVDDVRLQMSLLHVAVSPVGNSDNNPTYLRPSTFHPFKTNAYMPAY